MNVDTVRLCLHCGRHHAIGGICPPAAADGKEPCRHGVPTGVEGERCAICFPAQPAPDASKSINVCPHCHGFAHPLGQLCPVLGEWRRPDWAPDVEAMLSEREKTHGKYEEQAIVSGKIKDMIAAGLDVRTSRGKPDLTYGQLQALSMIANKIGRIVAGDANFADHWDDIAGYAKLCSRKRTGA